MATRSIVPRANNEGGLGSSSKMWANLYSVLATITTATITAATITTATITTGVIAAITGLVSAVITNTARASISTPAAGKITLFADTDKYLRYKDENGVVRNAGPLVNYSTTSQSPAASTRTYLAGSAITLPTTSSLQVGSVLRWRFSVTKTAAGTATSTYDICFGTTGTTSDTARVSFTKPAGTAAADEGWVEITCIIRSIGGSGVAVGQFVMTHNLAATGHAQIPSVNVVTVSGAFDTAAATVVGVCVTSGASDALTFQLVTAEAWNV